MKRLYMTCDCEAFEHTARFVYDPDYIEDGIYLDVSLCDKPKWYKRIWRAIKYIFGYNCRYGHFAEFIYFPKQVEELNEFLQKFLKHLDEKYND